MEAAAAVTVTWQQSVESSPLGPVAESVDTSHNMLTRWVCGLTLELKSDLVDGVSGCFLNSEIAGRVQFLRSFMFWRRNASMNSFLMLMSEKKVLC